MLSCGAILNPSMWYHLLETILAKLTPAQLQVIICTHKKHGKDKILTPTEMRTKVASQELKSLRSHLVWPRNGFGNGMEWKNPIASVWFNY